MSVTNGGRVHNTPQIQQTQTQTTQTNRQNAPTVPSNIRSQTPTNSRVSGNQRSQVSNGPTFGQKAMRNLKATKRNIGNFFRRVGNSQFGVGTGHFFQALVGKSAFTAARAAVRKDFGGRAGDFHLQVNNDRSYQQAQWANHGAWAGSVWNPIAAIGGLCGAIYGAIEGRSTPAEYQTKAMVKPQDNNATKLDVNQKKTICLDHQNNAVKATTRRTNSLKKALGMLNENPKCRMYTGSNHLRATNKIQAYRGIRENVFGKEFSTENLDFFFALDFCDKHPTAENMDMLFDSFVRDNGEFGVNIPHTERAMLYTLTNHAQTNGTSPITVDPQFKQTLMEALKEDATGPNFQQLPAWVQSRLIAGEQARNDGSGFHFADMFGAPGGTDGARGNIYLLIGDTMTRWNS